MSGTDDARQTFTFGRRTFLAAAGVTLSATRLGVRERRSAIGPIRQGYLTSVNGPPIFPPSLTDLQPNSPSAVQALLDYDVHKDTSARYMRSQVPIARRVTLPAATQANPKLDARPEILSLNPFYNQLIDGAPRIGDTRYGFDQRPYITRFAQYQDYVAGWIGAQNIANPAYVDAAHRNGSLGLGIIFQPYFSPTPGAVVDFVARDASGNYAVGDKLVDLAEYFGYDGYFVNIEGLTITHGQAGDLAAMFDSMHERARGKRMPAFYLQIYDAIWTNGKGMYEERFDKHNAGWVEPQKRVDSIFIDYAWPENFSQPEYAHTADYVAPSVALARRRGLDPFQVLFFGLDIQEENDGVHANALDYYADQVIPLNGEEPALASLGLFAQSDRMISRTRAELGAQASDPSIFERAIYVADRQFWSGRAQDPAVPATPVHPTVTEVVSPEWIPQYGIADFIPERTVISNLPFTTRFNTGRGDHFFLAGRLAAERDWYNLSVQDILPSWQWWTRDLSGSTGVPGLLGVDYDDTLAYDGASCLRIDGQLNATSSTEVRLFKTAVDAGQASVFSLIVRAGTPGAVANLRVGVSYLHQSTSTNWLTPAEPPRDLGEGWQRIEFDHHPRQGAMITAVSVGAIAQPGISPAEFAAYIGELRIMPRRAPAAPASPSGFTIDTATPSPNGPGLTVGLSWELVRHGIWYYDLRTDTRSPSWLGRIFGDAYVADAIEPGTRIALIAVTFGGTESTPTFVTVGEPLRRG